MLVSTAFLSLCLLFSEALGQNKIATIVIDPGRPSAYWLAAGTVSRLPIIPDKGLVTLPAGNIGWFEFSFASPDTGWRRLDLEGRPHLGSVELEIDAPDNSVRSGALLPGQWIWLTSGEHRLRVIANYWTGLPQISSIRLEAGEGLAPAFRLLVDSFHPVSVLGQCLPFKILTGGSPRPINIDVAFRRDGQLLGRETISVDPSPEPVIKSIPISCDSAGDVTAFISAAGSLRGRTEAQASYTVFDVAPIDSAFKKGELVAEIDPTMQAPDFASGETKITRGPAGEYRESSQVGLTRYVRSQSKIEPSWFAYRITGLKPGRSYLFEVEYPDDEYRVFVAAFRDSKGTGYPISVGVETGGVWPMGGHIARRSAIIWSNSSDGRVIIYNVHDYHRAAISRIRFFAIEMQDGPARQPQSDRGRDVTAWTEEGSNFRSLVGKGGDTTSVYTAVDRYMRLANTIKATIVSPTVAIYNFQLYPSRYSLTFAEKGSDLTAAFLLAAQRYRLNVIPELHPRADEVLWTARTEDELKSRLSVAATGATHYLASDGSVNRPPYYNALNAGVRAWYREMVGELADRYKSFPAFAGIQLRVSNWQNPALNNLVSLDWGYDKETVKAFFRDTSIPIPNGMLLTDDEIQSTRYRHDVLIGEFREAWIRWRCEKIREIFRDIVKRVRQARNDLKVQISFFALSNGEQPGYEDLREAGIDLKILKDVDGLVLIDSRFQHGAKEASFEWQRRAREEYIGPKGVRLFGDEKSRASTIFPMHYIEITSKVATSRQLGWAERSDDPWVSASSEPVGRLRLARNAELVALFDVYMIGDGGNGYVFFDEDVAEFMTEFRTLPRRPFKRVAAAPGTVVVRQSDKLFYAVNLLPKKQSIQIGLSDVSQVKRMTSGELIPSHDGVLEIELKPYELIVFEADRRIKKLSVSIR